MFRLIYFVMTFSVVLIIGCSSGNSLTMPDYRLESDDHNSTSLVSPLSVATSDSSGIIGNLIMAAYEGVVDTDAMDYHFAPLRSASAIGDSFVVDLTYYLDGVPCGNCLRIGQIEVDEDSNLLITFQIKHPFSATDSRLDLAVFDVRGILINRSPNLTTFSKVKADLNSDGTPETPVAGDLDFLLNADGYTTFFDVVVEGYLGLNIPGNLNPYKLFFVDPTQGNFNPLHPNGFENINQPRGYNVFKQGATFTDTGASQQYHIKAGQGSVINFLFILESSYGQSATFANTIHNPGQPGARNSPKFFMPEFSRKEAWKVDVEILENRLVPYDTESVAKINISAVDWQAGIEPSGDFSQNADLNDIRNKSDIEEVILHIPGVIDDVITQDLTDATGQGSHATPYEWIFDIENELGANPGDYFGIVAVRDEIGALLDGSTPPFGVKQDTQPVDFRDFVNYQIFKIRIAGLEGIFQADPFRKNLDITTDITHPTSADVVLDLGVVENDDSDVTGVYMPNASGGITRYNHNYTDAVFHGPGLLPPDTEGIHPNPTEAMPIRRLDANEHGVTAVVYYDDNETYRPISGEEPVLPAGNILHLFYSVVPPPTPPYDTIFPLTRFGGYWMPGINNPDTPTNEFEVEDPLPIEIWEGFDGSMGCVWEMTKLTNPNTGLFDMIYLGLDFSYPTDPADPPTPDVDYSVSLGGISAADIKGVDASDNNYVYFGLSGPDTPTGSLIVGFYSSDPLGNPIIGGIPVTTGNVIDLEILPFDDNMPRIINNYNQTSPILVALTDENTIEFIDSLTGRVIQVIDGNAEGSISGTAKHLDIGDRTFTVHVTHLDGSTPRVTVFVLR